jgi:multiple sugar transport system ATP-binding protein
MAAAAVVLDAVTKVYRDGTRAVDDLSLAIPPGSLFVLVGPSGCGKTTVLRLIAGLDDPTEGTIEIGGHDVADVAPKDRDVAMTFQNYALYPHLNVFENIAFGLKLRRAGRGEVDRRVRRAAAMLGLDEVLGKKPAALSGGQRQRVALGRALVREPSVFLMDEPLSNLDATLRDHMRGEIARIHRETGITTIYVTHDQVEAMTLGDLVGVMSEGKLLQLGTPRDIYARPADLAVAGFMGSPAMNLAEATVERSGDRAWARFGEHRLRLADHLDASVHDGRQVILGVRAEHLEDATLGSPRAADETIEVTIERRELLGSEVYLRFEVGSPLLLTTDPRLKVSDEVDAATQDAWAAERRNTFVARVTASTGADPGDRVSLSVRPSHVLLFDPSTGRAI